MNKRFGFLAHRRGGARGFGFVCGLALGFALAGPALAEERIDTCSAYRQYEAIGGGDSAMAGIMKQVCTYIGPVAITQPCFVYYTEVTSTGVFKADADAMTAMQNKCEESMPGGSALPVCGRDIVCAPIGSAADSNDMAAMDDAAGQCRDNDCREPDPVLMPQPDPNDPALECGVDLECRPPSDDMLSDVSPDEVARVTADDPPPVADVSANGDALDAALDLAFWQAIADSNDAVLYQAYLDRFANGTFAPIAKAKLAGLSGAPAADPAAAVQPAPAESDIPPTPRELFDKAEAVMATAYSMDVSMWDEAAREAMPLYLSAAEGGWAPAFVELGALYENGIGGPKDSDRALDYFLRAGRQGYLDGYARALMILDQFDNREGFVETFLTLYRIAPDTALNSFNSVGRNGPLALQAYLQDKGFYSGPLDGDFGPGSRTALRAYFGGAVPAATMLVDGDDFDEEAALIVEIQEDLHRIGCYDGAIDGQWGPQTAAAVFRLNHWTGSAMPTDRPTEEALFASRAVAGQLCGMD